MIMMKKITGREQKRILSLRMMAIEEALAVSAKELARICDVSGTTIYRIDGRTKSDTAISVKTLQKICDRTGVDIEWLLDFTNDSIQPEWTCDRHISRNRHLFRGAAGEGDGEPGGSGEETSPESPVERIKALRAEMHMSQVEFAQYTGLSSGGLACIESGRTRLTEQAAKKIENACKHGGAEWLLTGNERNKDYPVNEKMVEWLKDHRKERRRIYRMMMDEAEDFKDVDGAYD